MTRSGIAWPFFNQLYHQRRWIIGQGLCSLLHLSIFTVLLSLSDSFSSCVTHTCGCKVTGCLNSCSYIHFSKKLAFLSLAIGRDYMQFSIFTLPFFASNYFTAYLLHLLVFLRPVPVTNSCFMSGFKISHHSHYFWICCCLGAQYEHDGLEMKSRSNACLALMKI